MSRTWALVKVSLTIFATTQLINTITAALLYVASAAGCAMYENCKCFDTQTNQIDKALTSKVCASNGGLLMLINMQETVCSATEMLVRIVC